MLRGRYPDDMPALAGPFVPPIQAGDMEAISTPIDFLGVNYYSRSVVKHDPASPLAQVALVKPQGSEYSEMWEIYPPGIYEVLSSLQADYQLKNIYITENGMPLPDVLSPDGQVHDRRRARYPRSPGQITAPSATATAGAAAYRCWTISGAHGCGC